MPKIYFERNHYEEVRLQLKEIKLNCLAEKKQVSGKLFKKNYINYNDAVTLLPTFRNYVDKMEQQMEYMDNYVINGEIAVIVVTHYLDGMINNCNNDLRIIDLLEQHKTNGFTLEEIQEVIHLDFATKLGIEFTAEFGVIKEMAINLVAKKQSKGSK